MIMRVYALYGQNRFILIFLVLLMFIVIGIAGVRPPSVHFPQIVDGIPKHSGR